MPVLKTAQVTARPAPEQSCAPDYWPALDGLRGVAILAVFLSHFSGGHKNGNPLVRLVAFVMDAGWVGVDLFFVLSGFLITGILFDTAHQQKRVRNFYARRALRIFPIFYGVLFAFLLLTPVLHLYWHKENLLYFIYLTNIIPIFGSHFRLPGVGVDLVHLWSLAVEEQFYLLWPFIVWKSKSRTTLLQISVAVMAAALLLRCVLVCMGTNFEIVYQLLPTRADSLACGGALALLVRGPYAELLPVRWILPLSGAAVVAAFVASGSGLHKSPIMMTVGFSAIALFSACLVYCAQQGRGWIARVANHKLLRFFGRYSYGLYVYHGVLLVYLVPLLSCFERLTHFVVVAGLLYIVAALLISMTIAMLSYHFFEAPIIRLKRRFV